MEDKYVHGMDWSSDVAQDFELSNYRTYQFNLISKYIGKNILEVGSGDRSFTNQIVTKIDNYDRLVSIEPSSTLRELHKNKYNFPNNVTFEDFDLFDLTPEHYGYFDTIILVHVLEHIENDLNALNHLHSLLSPGGMLLIEVPAIKFLYSIHDEMLGHYRRYNKNNLKSAVNNDLFNIKKLWYQDPIGVLGSLIYFKIKKINLHSEEGISLAGSQGGFYDKYLIPIEGLIEKFITFPFGLSLTCIIQTK